MIRRTKQRWIRVLIGSIVGLALLGASWLLVRLTYGYTWSFEYWTNLKLLREVPSPPGVPPMGKYRRGTTIQPVVNRTYWIPLEDMTYDEVAVFFKETLPPAGWELVDEAFCMSDVSGVLASSDHIKITELIHVRNNQHWLYVSIIQAVDAQGHPIFPNEDNTSVELGLSKYQDYIIEHSGINDIRACVRGVEKQ